MKILNLFYINLHKKGAFTNKLTKYEYRKWEVRQINSISISEEMHNNIQILIKGNKIIKVVPRYNINVNEDFLTNYIRNYFLNYNLKRINFPLFFFKGSLKNISWKLSIIKIKFDFIFLNLSKKLKWKFIFFGFLSIKHTRESLFFFKYLVNKLGFSNLNFKNDYLINKLKYLMDFRNNLILKIKNRINFDIIFLLGINLRVEYPIFYIYILKIRCECIMNFLFFNRCLNKHFSKNNKYLGNNFIFFLKYMLGLNLFSIKFLNYEQPTFIFGFNFLKKLKKSSFYIFCFKFFYINFCNILFPNLNLYNLIDLGIYNRLNSLDLKNKYFYKKNKSFIFNYNFKGNHKYIKNNNKLDNLYTIDIKPLYQQKLNIYINKQINIFQGNYINKKYHKLYSLILPSKIFYEMHSKSLDCFGDYVKVDYLNLKYKSSIDDLNIFFLIYIYIFSLSKNISIFLFNFFNFFGKKSNFYLKKKYIYQIFKVSFENIYTYIYINKEKKKNYLYFINKKNYNV